MSAQDKTVLTLSKIDLTLEIYIVTLDFGLDTCQTKIQLYGSAPKVFGKCQMCDCYNIAPNFRSTIIS